MAKRFRSTRLPRRQSSPAFPGRLRQEQQRRIDGSDSPLTHSRAPTGYLDDSRLSPPHEDLRNGLREGDHIFFLEAIRGVDSRERRQVRHLVLGAARTTRGEESELSFPVCEDLVPSLPDLA